jgi:hypothetical protein
MAINRWAEEVRAFDPLSSGFDQHGEGVATEENKCKSPYVCVRRRQDSLAANLKPMAPAE